MSPAQVRPFFTCRQPIFTWKGRFDQHIRNIMYWKMCDSRTAESQVPWLGHLEQYRFTILRAASVFAFFVCVCVLVSLIRSQKKFLVWEEILSKKNQGSPTMSQKTKRFATMNSFIVSSKLRSWRIFLWIDRSERCFRALHCNLTHCYFKSIDLSWLVTH